MNVKLTSYAEESTPPPIPTPQKIYACLDPGTRWRNKNLPWKFLTLLWSAYKIVTQIYDTMELKNLMSLSLECSKQLAEATTNSLEGSPEPQSLRCPQIKFQEQMFTIGNTTQESQVS